MSAPANGGRPLRGSGLGRTNPRGSKILPLEGGGAIGACGPVGAEHRAVLCVSAAERLAIERGVARPRPLVGGARAVDPPDRPKREPTARRADAGSNPAPASRARRSPPAGQAGRGDGGCAGRAPTPAHRLRRSRLLGRGRAVTSMRPPGGSRTPLLARAGAACRAPPLRRVMPCQGGSRSDPRCPPSSSSARAPRRPRPSPFDREDTAPHPRREVGRTLEAGASREGAVRARRRRRRGGRARSAGGRGAGIAEGPVANGAGIEDQQPTMAQTCWR